MIKYISNLYLTDNTKDKVFSIKRKLYFGIGMVGIHIITLSNNDNDVFDIIPACMFKQRRIRHMDYTIVGLAEDYNSAIGLVERIISDHYKLTGRYTNLKYDFIHIMLKE